MTSIILTLGASVIVLVLLVMSFILGAVIGWIASEYFNPSESDKPIAHPEMYDEFGNYITEELIAVRFEPDDEYDYED